MKPKTQDAILLSSATVIGMTLVFVLLTVKENPALATVVGITAGLLFLVFGLSIAKSRLHRKHRTIVEYSDSAEIEPGDHIDVVFSPPVGIRSPRLTLASHNHKVEVEEIWHNGIGTLMGKPRALYYWHRGQLYPGIVDYHTALIIRAFNPSLQPAVLVAKLVGYQEKA